LINTSSFDVQINGATSTSFTPNSLIASSLQVLSTTKANEVAIGGYSGILTIGRQEYSCNGKLGTITLETVRRSSQAAFSLVSGSTSNDAGTANDASQFNYLLDGSYSILQTLAIYSIDAESMTPLDALAALKISVGLNPNAVSASGNILLLVHGGRCKGRWQGDTVRCFSTFEDVRWFYLDRLLQDWFL
jgi:hypothetical protein